MLIILLFVFFLLFTKILIKDKLSLVFLQLYLIWWAILLFISTFNPYGLFPVSEYIYGILILSIFCFSLGFISNKNIRNVNNNEKKLLNEDLLLKYLIELSKSKIFLFLLIFLNLHLMPKAIFL